MVPAATGISLSIIKPGMQSFASAMGQATYNVFGFALGTFLPGFYMQYIRETDYDNNPDGEEEKIILQKGMQLLFLWSFFGLLFLGA